MNKRKRIFFVQNASQKEFLFLGKKEKTMLSVTKRFKFDAAHHLPYYEGKCFRRHGHRFFLDVSVTGNIIKEGHRQRRCPPFSPARRRWRRALSPGAGRCVNAFYQPY